ncbi:lipoprotein-releasing ABC transporter ATP-binding protein LolD [Legionella spiritensis]|uniref:lipoprotein-releasing ABC transporter ATP-binding protein LolD n=1 Tax=Legionella spiritensis TaxID=452 RepID=UPI000F7021F2|nr:lipoprotein-releasing ABC transporter ATP-binding protein LolD [Legionella spiritensis]VEG89614.1 lipoprotein-releasing system ATP-binding protein [Legionella spiritensis]
MSNVILECQDVSKSYHDGTSSISVLDKIQFAINKGDRIAIVGASGSGKSTLLHLLGGLDKPSEGKLLIQGVDWQAVSEKKRCRLRNRNLGFVYQFHHLLPEFSALENVAMPLLLAEYSVPDAQKQAYSMLEKVGLGKRASHKPSQLSGGERQRVAIARALVHQPECVLADEPTGNLDHTTAMKVFDLMLSLNEQLNTSLVIVTHDRELASKMDKIYTIRDGAVFSERDEE